MAMRVLLIDDSVMVRDVLRNHVECLGGSVVAEAENTLQALDLFRTVEPDLVILDGRMPNMSGLEALPGVRAVVLAGEVSDGKVAIVAATGGNPEAGALVKQVAAIVGGGGGGSAEVAVAGGRDASRIPEALGVARGLLESS